jgi:RimJ/RimL family protein N-acetyltransferase
MLVGNRVRLRALESSDYQLLAEWLNDSKVMLYWGRPGNTFAVTEVAAQEESNASRGNSRKYVIETVEGVAIGQMDYYDLDWQARSAWISIMIGDPDYWSGGYGTDAMHALLAYLFDQLGLHRVALTTHASNERARKSYRKNGFVEEGILRDWAYFNGAWHDGVLMSVLAKDFAAI